MKATSNEAGFTSRDFRRALGNFATGVTIITARTESGEIVGATASSFNSLSMEPPLILWSCIKTARSCPVFEAAPYFAVNVLSADQADLSNHFARQQDDKFANVAYDEGIGKVPIFSDCAARFQCETYAKFDGGDHWIFVGKVLAFDDFGRPPLCFHQGAYSTVFNHLPENEFEHVASAKTAGDSRMAGHKFFLMLAATRAYQDAYRPKLVALELNLIEARLLLVVEEMGHLTAERLTVQLNAPIVETKEAIAALTERGFIAQQDSGYWLTDAGQAKVKQVWHLAETHANEAFCAFDDDQMRGFGEVLDGLIHRWSPA